jgi:hypothetical protein
MVSPLSLSWNALPYGLNSRCSSTSISFNKEMLWLFEGVVGLCLQSVFTITLHMTPQEVSLTIIFSFSNLDVCFRPNFSQ